MATSTKTGSGSAGNASNSEAMAKARAARGSGKRDTSNFTDRDKFALRTIQQARSALKKAADGLHDGFTPNAELLQACGKINGAVGSMLFD